MAWKQRDGKTVYKKDIIKYCRVLLFYGYVWLPHGFVGFFLEYPRMSLEIHSPPPPYCLLVQFLSICLYF